MLFKHKLLFLLSLFFGFSLIVVFNSTLASEFDFSSSKIIEPNHQSVAEFSQKDESSNHLIADSVELPEESSTLKREEEPPPPPLPVIIPSATPQMIDGFFSKYSSEYHVEELLLRKIAICESGYNPNAKNGIYGGMFQFSPGTWSSTRTAMGLDPNPDVRFNAEEAIRTATFKISRGEASAWENCL